MSDIDRISELVGNKDFTEAKKIIDQQFESEANNVEFLKLAGLTEVNLGDWMKARKYFESVVKEFNEPKFVCNWILGEVFKKLNSLNQEEPEILISPQNMAKLLKLYKSEVIGQSVARKLLDSLWGTNDDPEVVVKQQGLMQMSNSNELEGIIKAIMDENPKAVQELKAGNQKTMAFFVGQAMKKTQGKANPKLVGEIVQKLLD